MASKLFGIHISDEIVLGLMIEQIMVKLEKGLLRLKTNPTSFIGRQPLSTIQFSIHFGSWVGIDVNLRSFEKEITRFLQFGQGRRKRHRVVEYILFLLRKIGGLGVLSLQRTSTKSSGRQVCFMGDEAQDTPLQLILQASIQQLSFKRWGLLDYSWVLIPCNTLPIGGSNIWMNICRSWNTIKKNIAPPPPSNQQELQCILIWTPYVDH